MATNATTPQYDPRYWCVCCAAVMPDATQLRCEPCQRAYEMLATHTHGQYSVYQSARDGLSRPLRFGRNIIISTAGDHATFATREQAVAFAIEESRDYDRMYHRATATDRQPPTTGGAA